MLGKLLKYEIKAMGRIMLPLYAVMIFTSCLFAFNTRLNMSGIAKVVVDRFAIVTGFLFAAAVLTVGVVMVIIVIQRFYKNLLGTEGYLMFTLPTRTHEHILSKAISAFLWIMIGIAAGVLSGILMINIVSSWPEFLRELEDIWNQISPAHKVSPIIWLCVLIAVGIFESLCKVYAAIAAGSQFGSHRLIGSVLAYVAFGLIEMLLGLIVAHTKILSALKAALVGTNSAAPFTVKNMQAGILTALAGVVIYGLICWYLLDRRLNLE